MIAHTLKFHPRSVLLRIVNKGKLSPKYIGPYQISKMIDKVVYELELPQEFQWFTWYFFYFMLKKCMGDILLIRPTEYIGIKDSLSYEKILVQIQDRQVSKFRTKDVASTKSFGGTNLLMNLLRKWRGYEEEISTSLRIQRNSISRY